MQTGDSECFKAALWKGCLCSALHPWASLAADPSGEPLGVFEIGLIRMGLGGLRLQRPRLVFGSVHELFEDRILHLAPAREGAENLGMLGKPECMLDRLLRELASLKRSMR